MDVTQNRALKKTFASKGGSKRLVWVFVARGGEIWNFFKLFLGQGWPTCGPQSPE